MFIALMSEKFEVYAVMVTTTILFMLFEILTCTETLSRFSNETTSTIGAQ